MFLFAYLDFALVHVTKTLKLAKMAFVQSWLAGRVLGYTVYWGYLI